MPDPSQFNTDRTTLVPMWRDCCSRFFPSGSRRDNVFPVIKCTIDAPKERRRISSALAADAAQGCAPVSPALLMLGAVAVLGAIGCDGSDGSSAAAATSTSIAAATTTAIAPATPTATPSPSLWLYDLFRSDLRTLRRRKLLRPG